MFPNDARHNNWWSLLPTIYTTYNICAYVCVRICVSALRLWVTEICIYDLFICDIWSPLGVAGRIPKRRRHSLICNEQSLLSNTVGLSVDKLSVTAFKHLHLELTPITTQFSYNWHLTLTGAITHTQRCCLIDSRPAARRLPPVVAIVKMYFPLANDKVTLVAL